ncbi:MAG: adenylate kinase [Candidatus Solibacter usitatus]|nr:adenylate kinase [Candidatus Solibacter usitatus]
MIILLVGSPGSGKGTQARFISERLAIPTISTGDMLRAECESETVLGLAAQSILAAGRLVDDELVNAMVVNRLSRPDCGDGFILDGYPRTIPQAFFLDSFVEERGLPSPRVIHLDVPMPVLISRLSSRWHCSTCHRTYNLLYQPPARKGRCDVDDAMLVQRNDDTEQVVRQRLESYHSLAGPLLDHYAGDRYHRIDGQCPPEDISRQIEEALRPVAAIPRGR